MSHGVNDVRQTGSFVPDLISFFLGSVATEKLKGYKSSGTGQILAELIKAGGKHRIRRSTNLLTLFGVKKNYQSSRRNLLLYLFISQ
jgi:hypothetical protein